ncbi:MAG: hypothetical protein WCO56_29825 [Verrucomicrobiota bacterium]
MKLFFFVLLWVGFSALPGKGGGIDLSRLGASFAPNKIPIAWPCTNALPEKVFRFKVANTNYPASLTSNLLNLAEFTEQNRAVPEGEGVFKDHNVRYYRSPDQKRFLGIFPGQGWILYKNSAAIASTRQTNESVPDEKQALTLARQTFQRLGLAESELAFTPGGSSLDYTHAVRERSRRSPDANNLKTDTIARFLFFKRTINGFSSVGRGVAGGIWIGFGNAGQICDFEMVWRNVIPDKPQSVPGSPEIIRAIAKGHSVIQFDNPKAIESISVNQVNIHYLEFPGIERQREIYPYLRLNCLVSCQGRQEAAVICLPLADE